MHLFFQKKGAPKELYLEETIPKPIRFSLLCFSFGFLFLFTEEKKGQKESFFFYFRALSLFFHSISSPS